MSIVVFENPGEIDPVAITTFGISAKEGDNPIGFFGTGLKYAIAILLRGGHSILMQSGTTTHSFDTIRHFVRGQPFDVVRMNGTRELGFTTDVGKTWELWMSYRELHCNCVDEGGEIYVADEIPTPRPGMTRVIVDSAEFAKIYATRSDFLLIGQAPFLKLDGVDVYAGESRGIFFRGVLVHRFPKTEVSRFTYCITHKVDLTEDRTARYPIFLTMQIAAAVLEAKDIDFIKEVLTLGDKYFEHEFNFRSEGVWGVPVPSTEFMNSVEMITKDRIASTNQTAAFVYRDIKSKELKPANTILTGVEAEMLHRAVLFCKDLGFDPDEYSIIMTDSLGPNILGGAKGSNIYISRRAFMIGTKCVAGTLIEEIIHLKHGLKDESRAMQNFLIDRLVSLGEEKKGTPL